MKTTSVTICSVCGARFEVGNKFCAGCGLQLIAQAVTMRVSKPRTLGLTIAIASVVVIGAVISIGEDISKTSLDRRHANLIADVTSGKLNSPQAFQSRCGQATSTKTISGVPTLVYDRLAGEMLVDFLAPKTPHFQWQRVLDVENGKAESITSNEDPTFALNELNCWDRTAL